MREMWKPVPGHPKHEVSNKGRIRALPGALINRQPVLRTTLRKLNLNDGYLRVRLDGRMYHVHTLVLTVWQRPRRGKEECRHLNDDRSDNRYPENIVWGTRSEQHADRYRNGWTPPSIVHPASAIAKRSGEGNGQAKLTRKQVEEIKAASGSWGFRTKLAKKYGVSPATITYIRQGQRW